MSVLVDTSVWIDHFRHKNTSLSDLLTRGFVLIHPMIIGEIASGTPPSPRAQTMRRLDLLPLSQWIEVRATIAFIERESLFGLGCGLIDLMLLLSTLMTPSAQLWTLDRNLALLARRYMVAY